MSKEPERNPIDKFVPWFIVLFFAVTTAVLLYMVWIATRTAPGVVTEDAFKKGLQYGRVIEKQRIQDALGWGSELYIDKKKGKPAIIRFMLRDKDHKPIKDAEAQITFFRPTQDGMDVTVPMAMDEPGVYRTMVDLPAPGLWEARVAVKIGDTAYQTSKRVTLP